jgi:hypothetical protein
MHTYIHTYTHADDDDDRYLGPAVPAAALPRLDLDAPASDTALGPEAGPASDVRAYRPALSMAHKGACRVVTFSGNGPSCVFVRACVARALTDCACLSVSLGLVLFAGVY